MVKADQGHGPFNALLLSWSPISYILEGLTLCYPSIFRSKKNGIPACKECKGSFNPL
jgi:hypothetical protein